MFLGRVAVVTGGGQGIGLAIAQALAQAGARVAVVDLDPATAAQAAAEIDGIGLGCDMRDPDQIKTMLSKVTEQLGEVEVLISNAGFAKGAMAGPTSAEDQLWQDSWDLHVMAHLRASRLVLPGMLARGQGWLVNVASAAGLLSQIADAPYSASKHAAVSLAQSLAIEHGSAGIRVSCVCPLYVATPLLGYTKDSAPPPDHVISPQEVARAVLDGLTEGRFLILPHPEAAEHFRRRAQDTDRWVRGMQRLRDDLFTDTPPSSLDDLHRRF